MEKRTSEDIGERELTGSSRHDLVRPHLLPCKVKHLVGENCSQKHFQEGSPQLLILVLLRRRESVDSRFCSCAYLQRA